MLDMYRAKAAELFGVDYSDVTGEQRHRAKLFMYSKLYGRQTAFKDIIDVKATEIVPKDKLVAYHAAYPIVSDADHSP